MGGGEELRNVFVYDSKACGGEERSGVEGRTYYEITTFFHSKYIAFGNIYIRDIRVVHAHSDEDLVLILPTLPRDCSG